MTRVSGTSGLNRWVPVYDEQAQLENNREDVLSLLFREFYEALVRIADFIYTGEAPELTLYGAMKRLMQDKVAIELDHIYCSFITQT